MGCCCLSNVFKVFEFTMTVNGYLVINAVIYKQLAYHIMMYNSTCTKILPTSQAHALVTLTFVWISLTTLYCLTTFIITKEYNDMAKFVQHLL